MPAHPVETAAKPGVRHDARIMALIGTGHFLSHFYMLCLPPLFLFWRAEFGASFAELGLNIDPFAAETRTALEALELPPGTSVANPIDAPVGTLQEENGWIAGKILDRVYDTSNPDAIVMHLNLASFVGRGDKDPVDNLIKVAEHVQTTHPGRAHFLLVLRSDGSQELDDIKRKYRQQALAVGIPVYDEVTNAAQALSVVQAMEVRFAARQR